MTYNIKPDSHLKLRKQIHAIRETLKYIMALENSLCQTRPNPLVNPLSLLLTVLCHGQISPKIRVLVLKEAKMIIENLSWLQSAEIEVSYKRKIIQQLSFLRDLAKMFSINELAMPTLH